jgi:hypothetical protein
MSFAFTPARIHTDPVPPNAIHRRRRVRRWRHTRARLQKEFAGDPSSPKQKTRKIEVDRASSLNSFPA